MLSRCLFNSNGLGGGFRPRQRRRSAFLGFPQRIVMIENLFEIITRHEGDDQMKRFKNKYKLLNLNSALLIMLLLAVVGMGQRTPQRPSLIFSHILNQLEVENYPECSNPFLPVIFVFEKNEWRTIYFSADNFFNNKWRFVGKAKTGKDIWALTEYEMTGYGPNLEIIHSKDDGRTWKHIGTLEKISYLAGLHSFTMQNDKGQLTIEWSSGGEPNQKGFYTYTTADKGKTWSKPKYSKTPPPEGSSSLEKIAISDEVIGRQCMGSEN